MQKLIGSLLVAAAAPNGDCSHRPIKLNIHLDLTYSFEDFQSAARQTFPGMFYQLKASYPNLEWSVTGFGDRPERPDCNQHYETCLYVAGSPHFTEPEAEKFQALDHLLTTHISGQTDDPEDPFDGVPQIAQQIFKEYQEDKDELRLLLFISDAAGKYSPDWDNALNAGDKPIVYDFAHTNICSCAYKWPTIKQIRDPLDEYHIYPVALIKDTTNAVDHWAKFFKDAGYPEMPLRELKEIGDAEEVIQYIIETIDSYQCKHPVTSSTTTTNYPTTTTTIITTTSSPSTTTTTTSTTSPSNTTTTTIPSTISSTTTTTTITTAATTSATVTTTTTTTTTVTTPTTTSSTTAITASNPTTAITTTTLSTTTTTRPTTTTIRTTTSGTPTVSTKLTPATTPPATTATTPHERRITPVVAGAVAGILSFAAAAVAYFKLKLNNPGILDAEQMASVDLGTRPIRESVVNVNEGAFTQ